MTINIECEHRPFEETLRRCSNMGGVDLIVTSPPYPDARPGQYLGDAPHDWTWPDYQRLGDHVARALRPGGFCAINIDGPVRERRKGIGSERDLIAFKLAIDWAERVGLRFVEHCAYVRLGTPGRFDPRWRSGWEPIHLFQRTGAGGYFDRWGATLERKTKNSNFNGAQRHGGKIVRYEGRTERYNENRILTTAIDVGAVGNNYDAEHPAPFDSRLADAFVLCYCPLGGVVCDPFVGSGTVAMSCANHGRSFIGGDLGARASDGQRWADIARERAIAERDRPRQIGLGLE